MDLFIIYFTKKNRDKKIKYLDLIILNFFKF